MHRVQSYLHPSTLQALIKKVEEVLVRDQLEVIYGEAKALLNDEKHQGPRTRGGLKTHDVSFFFIDRFGTSIQISQPSAKCDSRIEKDRGESHLPDGHRCHRARQ